MGQARPVFLTVSTVFIPLIEEKLFLKARIF
jgi:hypothetical protein